MLRLVLDTNVIVSALLRSGGFPEAAFSLGINRVVQLCISQPILDEYSEVLYRRRLAIDPVKVATAITKICEVSHLIRPNATVRACSDPDDNIFLECAEASGADYLVTGNTAHFPDRWIKTEIVTPRRFVEIVIAMQHGKIVP